MQGSVHPVGVREPRLSVQTIMEKQSQGEARRRREECLQSVKVEDAWAALGSGRETWGSGSA